MKRLFRISRRSYMQYLVVMRKFRYQNPQGFIYFASTLIGVMGGLSAVLLKNLARLTEEIIYHNKNIHIHYLTIILPAIGILLTVLYIKFFVKDDISHGVAKVMGAISKERGKIRNHNTYTSIISSSLTVGFGGSVGLEAPIVYTGAALGSNFAKSFNLNLKLRTLFIACGCSAAIAGIFKAPIAGIIFSMEVMMIDLSMWSMIPILISSVTGALISYFLMGEGVSFYFAVFEHFDKTKIPFYVLLGIICGLFALYYTRVSRFVDKIFSAYKNIYSKAIIGGLLLGILILIFPPLFGEGYLTLQNIMSENPSQVMDNSVFYFLSQNDWYLIGFLFIILFIKAIASTLTTSSGGIGGVFAPALFTGGILGFIFAKILNLLQWVRVSEHNFSLVGMAGVMSGIMHAPLTSIFLIAEITGGYSLLFPLIITSSIAYLVKYHLDKYSVYTYSLKGGKMITHNKDKEAIRRLQIQQIVDEDFVRVPLAMPLSEFVKIVPDMHRNIAVVEDPKGKFVGWVRIDEILDILLNKSKYEKLRVSDVVSHPLETLTLYDDNAEIFDKFDKTTLWFLPIVENGIYIGMLSKSKLLQTYRKMIIDFSED